MIVRLAIFGLGMVAGAVVALTRRNLVEGAAKAAAFGSAVDETGELVHAGVSAVGRVVGRVAEKVGIVTTSSKPKLLKTGEAEA